jgi:hypothetical protein
MHSPCSNRIGGKSEDFLSIQEHQGIERAYKFDRQVTALSQAPKYIACIELHITYYRGDEHNVTKAK